MRRPAVLLLAFLAACGGATRADRIVEDRTLFNEHFPDAIAMMREECPRFAEAAGASAPGMGAITETGLQAAVPAGFQPELARVLERHGAPDSVAEGLHWYDDIGLRDSAGLVVDIVMPCAGT